ncbi:helix-turn-helix domain-containing protein [Streptomyces noursei]|uniref:helix-turn-helix domain-containing protein n=1 Tax=Streptomyces noursei TaxID=1971 RepID=UPI001674FFD6|nr:helix-turn-helix transcriptional regulator [Streptomyces noursei]MCZ1014887.1 helix-turn-helix transcriptional regulator [Streptomyces noursei]GGX49879.1 transcriptional regulator [Streptomyces noursei]
MGNDLESGQDADLTDSRRRFAEELKSARELHDPRQLSQEALGRLVRKSKSTISRVETCKGPIPPDLPALLDEVFGTDGTFKRLYEEIVARSFPSLYRQRMALERSAIVIREWSPTIIPGLFQTADYARCLLKAGAPRAGEDEVARGVENRLLRQRPLNGDTPPDVHVVLCESVLRRRFCPRDIMQRQLKALLEAAKRPTVRLQVLPLDAPGSLFIDWPVSLITSPNHAVSVCVETYRTANIIEEPEHVRRAIRTYDELTSEALSTRESTRIIEEQMEALS